MKNLNEIARGEMLAQMQAIVGSYETTTLLAGLAVVAVGWLLFFAYFLSTIYANKSWKSIGAGRRTVVVWSWFWIAGAIVVFATWWGFFAWRLSSGLLLIPATPDALSWQVFGFGAMTAGILLIVGWLPRPFVQAKTESKALVDERVEPTPAVETVSPFEDTPYQPLYPDLSFGPNDPAGQPVSVDAPETQIPEQEEPPQRRSTGRRLAVAAVVALLVVAGVGGLGLLSNERSAVSSGSFEIASLTNSIASLPDRLFTRFNAWLENVAHEDTAEVIRDEALAFQSNDTAVRTVARADDFTIDVRRWRTLADQGGADAQYKLGVFYANGRGTPRNFVEAYKWLNLASAQGHVKALQGRDAVARRMSAAEIEEAQRLARTAGVGVEQVPERLLQMPRQELVRTAQLLLNTNGFSVGAPDGIVGPRTRSAVREFQRQSGLPSAGTITPELVIRLESLASAQQPAAGNLDSVSTAPRPLTVTPKLPAPAALRSAPITDCDRLAAHPSARLNSGKVDGVPFERIDAGQAVLVCEQAAAKYPNEPRFLFQLARSLHKAGRHSEALTQYSKSGNQGFTLAQRNIGLMYANGSGVDQDFSKAAQWLRHAADRCDIESQFALATLYESGRGVDRDSLTSRHWFQAAAIQGHLEARDRLVGQGGLPRSARNQNFSPEDDAVVRHVNHLLIEQPREVTSAFDRNDYGAAVDALRPRADAGDAPAQTLLGYMYWSGLGVEANDFAAVDWYRLAADQNHPNAQYLLGYMHQQGLGVLQESGKALQLFRQAASQGVTAARISLGAVYENAQGARNNQDEALAQYFSAAEAGLPGAQYKLGLAYESGRGVETDLDEAVKWYRLAADQDFALAQNQLGILHSGGLGVPRDQGEATRWFAQAADQGLPDAQFNLAKVLSAGSGSDLDASTALNNYMLAAAQGHAEGQLNMAYAYLRGRGVAQDHRAAVSWFEKAAAQCNVDAQFELAKMNRLGQGVAKPSAAEELKWLKLAAEQGHAGALNALSERYSAGAGVAKSSTKALRATQLAARQGHANAQFKLAEFYAEGSTDVPPDNEQAAAWYRLAAEQGHVDAQSKLARMYRYGLGVPRSFVEALAWYRPAAEKGDAPSQHALATAYSVGAGIEQNFDIALTWYRRAADSGDAGAQRDLGLLYFRGDGVLQDYVQAHFWLDRAAAQGDTEALAARDQLIANMTPAQISEAESLSQNSAGQDG